MTRLYIAGPYSHPDPLQRERNTHAAFAAGLAAIKAGHAPFIPHLSHHFDQWAQAQGISIPYETYMAWDDAFLSVCDGLLSLGSSPGADRELERARSLGIPITKAVP
jgi:hypothetical protein